MTASLPARFAASLAASLAVGHLADANGAAFPVALSAGLFAALVVGLFYPLGGRMPTPTVILTVVPGELAGDTVLVAYLGTPKRPHLGIVSTISESAIEATPGLREAWDETLELLRAGAEKKAGEIINHRNN